MEEKILAKGKMMKLNVLTILFAIMGMVALIWFISVLDVMYPEEECLPFVSVGCFVVAAYFHFWFGRGEITVTDKRVYGKASFGKRVDLPLDMISVVGVSAFKGVHVATASGRITFYLCQNRDEVFGAISKLLVGRQEKATSPIQTTITQEVPPSNADELKKFKELLDGGVISQEEFDAKKKQLLGL